MGKINLILIKGKCKDCYYRRIKKRKDCSKIYCGGSEDIYKEIKEEER